MKREPGKYGKPGWNRLGGLSHGFQVLTLVLTCAVVFGVGVIGYQVCKEVERFVLVERGMCRLPPKLYPTARQGGRPTFLRQIGRSDVRL